MRVVTVTELVRNLDEILDRMSRDGEAVIVQRSHREVARLVPGSVHRTAPEVLGDLHQTLDQEAAAGWLADSRLPQELADELPEPRDL